MKKLESELTFIDWLFMPTIAATCTSKRKWVRLFGILLFIPFIPWTIIVAVVSLTGCVLFGIGFFAKEWWEEV